MPTRTRHHRIVQRASLLDRVSMLFLIHYRPLPIAFKPRQDHQTLRSLTLCMTRLYSRCPGLPLLICSIQMSHWIFHSSTTGRLVSPLFISLFRCLTTSPVANHLVSELSLLTAPGFDMMDNNSPTDTLDGFLQQLSQGSHLPSTQPSPDHVIQEFGTPPSMPKTPPRTMANLTENWSQGIFMNQSNPQILSASGPKFVEFGSTISGFDSTMFGPSSALTPDEIITQSEAAIRQTKLQKIESLRAELAVLEKDTAV